MAGATSTQRVIWNGEPGTTWVNDTGKVRWQLICRLSNTCGACLQYHLAIGPSWPIQLHFGCNCQQVQIQPGAEAPHKFVDFRELLDGMRHDQQVAAIGAANYKLLKAGVVKWTDIVTKYRVRTLREVMALNKVSLETAIKARVKPAIAKEAYEAVHAPEAEMVRQHRQELLDKLKGARVSSEYFVNQLARATVGQAEILTGGGTVQSLAPFVAAIPIPHAEALGALMKVWTPKPKKKPPAGSAPAGPAAPAAMPEPAAFQAQVEQARQAVPEVRLYGDKAWIHDVWAEHQAVPENPRLTLDEFKALLLQDENRGKIVLSRADLAHRMNQADVAASQTEYILDQRVAATFNFIRPKPQKPQ